MKFKSEIMKGIGLGKKIGFPTINLAVPNDFKLEPGVYEVKVKFGKEEKEGAMFYGTKSDLRELKKTAGKKVLEIFILDFDRDIYGTEAEVNVGKKIRGEMNFKSLEELKERIEKDVEEILKYN